MNKKTLIKNIRILKEPAHDSLLDGHIIIENDKIHQIIHNKDQIPDILSFSEIYDGKNMIAIPGLINSHYHSYSNLLKGTLNKKPLEPWVLYTVAYGYSLNEKDLETSVLLGAAEMIRNGITSCLDHFPHIKYASDALNAYNLSGIRTTFAPMLQDIPDEYFFNIQYPNKTQEDMKVEDMSEFYNDFFEQIIKKWHNKNGRIQIALGPNAPQRCSTNTLKLSHKLSRKYNLKIHMHLLETLAQTKQIKKVYTKDIITYLDELNLLNQNLSIAHGVFLDHKDISVLRDRQVSIVHNPVSNLMLGSGTAPVNEFLKNDINVAIGTDSSNCGGLHNLFETMRLTAILHRPGYLDFNNWIDEANVLRMATQAGSNLIGFDDQLGVIKPGYKADIVLLDTNNTTWSPTNNVLSQLVFQETGSSVNSVFINGNLIMKDKNILTFNENDVLKRAKELKDKILNQSAKKIQEAKETEPYFLNAWYKLNQ